MAVFADCKQFSERTSISVFLHRKLENQKIESHWRTVIMPPRSAPGELKANGGEIFTTPLVNTRYIQRQIGSIEAQWLSVAESRCW